MTKLELPDNKYSIFADEVVSRVGRTASWIWVILLSIIILNVTLRYLFSEGRIEFEELIFSFPFVEKSWKVGEISQSPGGLPFRWLLKAVIPFSFFLLGLSILSRVSKLMTYLAGNRT